MGYIPDSVVYQFTPKELRIYIQISLNQVYPYSPSYSGNYYKTSAEKYNQYFFDIWQELGVPIKNLLIDFSSQFGE